MALRGTLNNLGLAGVLQLIGQNSRQGVLTVDHGEHQANFYFVKGELVRVDGTGACSDEALGIRLVAAKLLPAAQYKQLSASAGGSLMQRLRGHAGLDERQLRHFAKIHSTEALQQAMLWPTGFYAFLPNDGPHIAHHEGLRADHLLMDALRVKDNQAALQAQIPNRLKVYEVVRSLEDYLVSQSMAAATSLKSDFDSGFSLDEPDLNDEASSHGRLGHNDRLIYNLVNGERDVQAIIDESGLTAFDALTALVALLDAQLLMATKRLAKQTLQADTQLLARRPKKLVYSLKDAIPMACRAAFFAAATTALLMGHRSNADLLQRFLWQQQAPCLLDALELCRARTGSYPATLQGLGIEMAGAAVPLYGPDGAGYQLRRLLPP